MNRPLPRTSNLLLLFSLLILAPLCTSAEPKEETQWRMATRLYSDNKAKEIGDLLTVLITEETLATKDAKSSSSKKSSLAGTASFVHPNLDGRETPWTNATLPAYSLETSRTFDGDGSIENKEKFTASITVRVIDKMPNGNLLIEGKRSLVIQDESMEVTLSGTVRPTDIKRDNTITSSDIADAAIQYVSKGPLVNNQKRGFFTRFWNWVNPF